MIKPHAGALQSSAASTQTLRILRTWRGGAAPAQPSAEKVRQAYSPRLAQTRPAPARPCAAAASGHDAAAALVVIEPVWLSSAEFDAGHREFTLSCLAELRTALAARGLPLLADAAADVHADAYADVHADSHADVDADADALAPAGAMRVGVAFDESHARWPWSTTRRRFVDARMQQVCELLCWGRAGDVTVVLATAASLQGVQDAHLAPWLGALPLTPRATLLPSPAPHCNSLSEFWTRASKGLMQADELPILV